MARSLVSWLLPIWISAVACGVERESEPKGERPGLVVERVSPGGAAALAGIEAGDRLLSWRRRAADGGGEVEESGSFERIFDPHWVEVLHGARGGVELEVRRSSTNGQPRILDLPISGNTWRLWARPSLPDEKETAYRAVLAEIAVDDPESVRAAAAELRELGGSLEGVEARVAAALHAGRLLREHSPGEDPGDTFAAAVAAAEASAEPALLAWASQESGWAAQQARRLPDAVRHHERALALYTEMLPDSLLEANARQEAALVRAQLGELERAVAGFREVLAVRRRLAPDSLVVAATLNNLGNYVSDLAEQQRYHEEALDLRERAAPESLDTASSLNNLGNVAWARGDLRRAEELLDRSRALLERTGAPPRFRGGVTGNLALVARERGDLASAELHALEALRIFEQHEPRGPFHSEALGSIGLIRRERGDLAGAETSFREAFEIAREIAEVSPRSINALLNLGDTLSRLGRHEEAARALGEGAALQERLDPASVSMASVWTALANVAHQRGDTAEEERLLRAALERWEDQAPDSLLVARALDHLGSALAGQGAYVRAAPLHERALAITDAIAPGTLDEARIAQHLGRLRRQQGRVDEALALYARAVSALESQAGRLGGGDDTRSQFRAANQELYQEQIELMLERGLVGEAFSALERSRAQAFVAMLAERDLLFGRELPEELATRRARLEHEYDRTLGELATVSPREDPGRATALRERLLELRRQHESMVTDLRAAAPDLAALRYPRTRGVGERTLGLREGSLLLEYRVGPAASQLFAESSDGTLTVHRLDIGEPELEGLVDRFLVLLRAGADSPDVDRTRALEEFRNELGAELYRRLVAPASSRLDGTRRLVIVPDGPLHALPFAALVDPDHGTVLVERFSYVVAPSAAALAGLLERSGSASASASGPESFQAVAFGDPDRDDYATLHWSRAEVRAIERELERPTRVVVGASATEESVESIAGRLPYLHFAVHGVLDSHAPLDSALALSTAPGSARNGLLQAWEVMERVRVDADLAVLSGCETAVGEERAGEGLIGLVRAFHFAGARAVLASLWRVPDRGTAVLMARFYHHLESGVPPSEALRAAQLELLHRSPEARAALRDIAPLRRGLRLRLLDWWFGGTPDSEVETTERLRDPALWAAFQVHGAERDDPQGARSKR